MSVPLQSFFSLIFLDACIILVIPPMCSIRMLSLLVTPPIHLSILISFTSSRASCPLVAAQVSAPYLAHSQSSIFLFNCGTGAPYGLQQVGLQRPRTPGWFSSPPCLRYVKYVCAPFFDWFWLNLFSSNIASIYCMSPQETAEHLNKRGAESWATTTFTLRKKLRRSTPPTQLRFLKASVPLTRTLHLEV